MLDQLASQVSQAAVYGVRAGGGDGLTVIRELLIVLLGIEAGVAGGGGDAYWLQLQATKVDGAVLTATVLVDDPRLSPARTGNTRVLRYIYQEGHEQPVEYVDAVRGTAVTTVFGLVPNFFPVFDEADLRDTLFPDRGTYLGLPIVKRETRKVTAAVPSDVLRLELDPELIIGTSRNFRDVEGERIWSGEDYTYRRFEQADYEEMIDAGVNHFRVDETQAEWVRRRPVFYVKRPRERFLYPEAFYRANWRGMTMYMDEPAVHLAWFFHAHSGLAKSLDGPAAAARMLERLVTRTHADPGDGRMALHNYIQRWFDLGTLTLAEDHYPAWETQAWSAWYQLKAGLSGVVHEGRYINHVEVRMLNAHFDARIPDTPEAPFSIHHAWFRGAARTFGGDWGTSIYGQCERAVAPLALTEAYDRGARYAWFWTSDRRHHVPYAEQLELTRHLRRHARAHPRPPMDTLRDAARAAIVVPDGYVLSDYYPIVPNALWCTEVFHLDRLNGHGLSYRDVLRPVALQIERYLREDIPFDLLYDDGNPAWRDYEEAVIVSEDGTARWFRDGEPAGTPPEPSRSPAELAIEPPEITIVDQTSANADPLTIHLTARIENVDGPIGFRSFDWNTQDWEQVEAFWSIYEDPDEPAYRPVGRELHFTFKEPGRYKVRAWTCNEHGMAARDEAWIDVSGP